jgi:hypothetical protein
MRRQHHGKRLRPCLVVALLVDLGVDRQAGIVDDDIEPAEMRGASSTTALISSRFATSSVQAFAISPLAVISAATARAPSAPKSVTATRAPSAANTRAVARPMPLAAPVMRTVNPLTERLSGLKSDMRFFPGRFAVMFSA